MNIRDLLQKIFEQNKSIFEKTTQDYTSFGKAHHVASCVHEFSENIADANEKNMLTLVSVQLESAYINLAYGMYRQAFIALRLALELGLGAAYFSVHKLEHYEWIHGKKDIVWSQVTDTENGVLSKRFAKAFFPELESYCPDFQSKATTVYRNLSEHVHGNNDTWNDNEFIPQYSETLVKLFFTKYQTVTEILIFALSCRYLKSFSAYQLDSLEFIAEDMNHITPIREHLGGPKE